MCDACRMRGEKAKDKHHSIEDFDDEPRYRKVPKRSKFCKKSKTKEACEFTEKVYKWTYPSKDSRGNAVMTGYYVLACKRCRKESGFHSFTTPIAFF